jgi:hypothetical protein
MKFNIRCNVCGDQNPLDNRTSSSVHVYFERGSEMIMDRFIFFCTHCGNKEEHGIAWPLDIGFQLKPRSEVRWFAKEMESTLKKNDHKGGWQKETMEYLFNRLKEEVDELEPALYDKYRKCIREAADVANFAMMIADNNRAMMEDLRRREDLREEKHNKAMESQERKNNDKTA